MVTVVHAADLHIDSPLRGIGRIEGAPVDDFRLATRRAFARLIDTCIEESANMLVLAGDVFDGEWRDFNTGLFFVRQLTRLRDVGTEVVMVRGNHDAESALARHIPLPEHVFTFAAEAAETREYPKLGIAVHGQSYASRSVEHNLAEAYPSARPGWLNLGVLHTNAVGSAEHGNYAPCSVSQLVRHGYDYWALGHVHRHQVLHQEPWVVYPGNLQGRHAHETGAKGCTVLRVVGTRVEAVTQRAMDVLRWEELVVNADALADAEALLGELRQAMRAAVARADGRPVVVRVTVQGTALRPALAHQFADPRALVAQIRAVAAEQGELWIEKVRFVHQPGIGLGHADELHELFAALRSELGDLAANPENLTRHTDGLAPLLSAVAPYLEHRPDAPDRLVARLGELEAFLLAKLGAAPVSSPGGPTPTVGMDVAQATQVESSA